MKVVSLVKGVVLLKQEMRYKLLQVLGQLEFQNKDGYKNLKPRCSSTKREH